MYVKQLWNAYSRFIFRLHTLIAESSPPNIVPLSDHALLLFLHLPTKSTSFPGIPPHEAASKLQTAVARDCFEKPEPQGSCLNSSHQSHISVDQLCPVFTFLKAVNLMLVSEASFRAKMFSISVLHVCYPP